MIDAVTDSKDDARTYPREDYGRFLAERMMKNDGNTYFALMTIMGGDNDARKIGDKVRNEHWLGPLKDWLGPPNASARVINFVILSGGFASIIRQSRIDGTAGRIDPATVDWFAATMQAIVDGANVKDLERE